MKVLLKEIDLSKAHEHEHPDIVLDKTYLVRINGNYYVGKFTRQWFGWSFSATNSYCIIQFDAPDWNKSQWQNVWEINEKEIK